MRSTRVQGWPLHRCHSEYYQLLGWDRQLELETSDQSEKKHFHSRKKNSKIVVEVKQAAGFFFHSIVAKRQPMQDRVPPQNVIRLLQTPGTV